METQVISVMSLGIVSILFPFGVKYLKKVFDFKGTETKLAVAMLCLVLAGLFYLLGKLNFWSGFAAILMTSQTIYALFMNNK